MTKPETSYSNKTYYSTDNDVSERDEFLPLSHSFRREILFVLKDKNLTFTNLLNNLNQNRAQEIGKSRLHQHLEILVNGKFLRRYRNGGNTLYVLNPDKFKELAEFLNIFISKSANSFLLLSCISKDLPFS